MVWSGSMRRQRKRHCVCLSVDYQGSDSAAVNEI